MSSKQFVLQRGNQVVRFIPDTLTMQWCVYKDGEWVLLKEEKKNEMFMFRNNYKTYIKKGFRPNK